MRVPPSSPMDAGEARRRIVAAAQLYDDDEFTEAALALRGVPVLSDLDENLAEKCRKIRECDSELVTLLEDMVDGSKWVLKYQSRGVRVSLESSQDKLIRVRCEGEAAADVFSLCACLLEVDLFPEWMPGVDEALVTRKVSKFRKVVRISGPKPWPIKRDEAHVVAYGDVVDCGRLGAAAATKRAGVGVYLKPVPNPPVTKGRHLIELSGGWFIEPLPRRDNGQQEESRSRLTVIARIDPKIRFLPNWVVNFVVKNIAYLFIPMIARQATAFKRPSGRHTDRIDVQPDVYREIELRLAKLSASSQHDRTKESLDNDQETLRQAAAEQGSEFPTEHSNDVAAPPAAASPPLIAPSTTNTPVATEQKRYEQRSPTKRGLSTFLFVLMTMTAIALLFAVVACWGLRLTPTPPPPPPPPVQATRRRRFEFWRRRRLQQV